MKITAITGSGISAASGIKTYRAAGSGWDEYANGIAHARSYGNHLPKLWKHWTEVARIIDAAEPNDAHLALAEVNAGIVTQNVDRLHQRAGSEDVIELHGDMATMRCLRCRQATPCDLTTDSPICSNCGSSRVRANVVLFGERLLSRDVKTAERMIRDADVVLVIGTSGEVYPTRGFINDAVDRKQRVVLFDIEPWKDSPEFSEVVLGSSESTVREFLTREGLG